MSADLCHSIGIAKPEVMDVDESPEPEAEPEVNLANAVDLSESEDEEELEVKELRIDETSSPRPS